MKQKNPKFPGLKTPRFCVFLHGFLNGRMNTAGVEDGKSRLTSAHIHNRLHRFSEFCQNRLSKLERETWELRTEARSLIPELRELILPPMPQERVRSGYTDAVSDSQATRMAAAADAREEKSREAVKQLREEVLARRVWILRRLVKIREELTLRERLCIEELSATAHALQAQFCVYGHGVLLKPLCAGHIPQVEFESLLDTYHSDCEALRLQITQILDQEV